MVKSRRSTPPQSAEQKREAILRGWMNWLNIWSVCDNTACKRANCCRAWESGCGKRNFSRLPEGVQDAFVTLMDAREGGLPFDEAWADLEADGFLDALGNWRALVRGPDGGANAVH